MPQPWTVPQGPGMIRQAGGWTSVCWMETRTYRPTGLCLDGDARQRKESERQESRHLSGWEGGSRGEVGGKEVVMGRVGLWGLADGMGGES